MKETIQGITATLEIGFDKIAENYGIPSEYHIEAKAALVNEVELLVKEAGFGADFVSSFGGNEVGKAALGLGAAGIAGLSAIALDKIGRAFGQEAGRASYDKALRKAIAESEILQNDPIKAKRMGDTIFGFAPTVASDFNVLSNILVNSIHGDSMDLQTVRAVTELEEKLVKMHSRKH